MQQQRPYKLTKLTKAKFTIAARSSGQEIKRQKTDKSSLGSEIEGRALLLLSRALYRNLL